LTSEQTEKADLKGFGMEHCAVITLRRMQSV